MMKRVTTIATCAAIFLAATWALAETPRTMSIQGMLTDGTGDPLTDGTYTVTFRIYSVPSDGVALWSEQHDVDQTDGVFQVVAGLTSSLDPAWFDQDLYLETERAGEAPMTPRIRLTTSPYAFRAAVADSVAGGTSSSDDDWLIQADDIFRVDGRVFVGTTPIATARDERNMGSGPSSKMTIHGDNAGLFVRMTEADNTEDQRTAIYALRRRSQRNDGSGYAVYQTNTGVTGFNLWGDNFTFGVAGYSFFDFGNSGGVLGARHDGSTWGALGYQDPTLTNWGIYTPHDASIGGTAVLGGMRLETGAVAGHVLTSDASGNAVWLPPSGGSDGVWTPFGDHAYRAADGTVAIGTSNPVGLISGVATLQISDDLFPGIALDREGSSFRRWTILQEGISGELQFGNTTSAGTLPGPVFKISEEGRVATGGIISNAWLHVPGGNGDVSGTSGDFAVGTGSASFRVGVHTSGTPTGEVNIRARTDDDSGVLDLGVDDHDVMRLVESTAEIHDPSGNRMISHQAWNSLNAGAITRMYSTLQASPTVVLDAQENSTEGAMLSLARADGTPSLIMDADHAGTGVSRVTTDVLAITGGSDLSEQFDLSDADVSAEPGMVVCIDPERPGRLTLSDRAYDHRVAGVISGAGGVNTGMLMGQRGSAADGELPVALVGRVYVWADADRRAIAPGDLLTTSDTRGHAMKVTDRQRAGGAILGKAMTSLESGRGLVLVLVALQ